MTGRVPRSSRCVSGENDNDKVGYSLTRKFKMESVREREGRVSASEEKKQKRDRI